MKSISELQREWDLTPGAESRARILRALLRLGRIQRFEVGHCACFGEPAALELHGAMPPEDPIREIATFYDYDEPELPCVVDDAPLVALWAYEVFLEDFSDRLPWPPDPAFREVLAGLPDQLEPIHGWLICRSETLPVISSVPEDLRSPDPLDPASLETLTLAARELLEGGFDNAVRVMDALLRLGFRLGIEDLASHLTRRLRDRFVAHTLWGAAGPGRELGLSAARPERRERFSTDDLRKVRDRPRAISPLQELWQSARELEVSEEDASG